MLRCRPKYRSILSRQREDPDRYAYLSVVGSAAEACPAGVAGSNRGRDNDAFVSAASIWEIAIKRAIGKLSFDRPIVAPVLALGFEILPVAGAHAEHAGSLPLHHNDPFDRLLIAQANLEGMVLGTQDRLLQPYGMSTLGLDY